MPHNMAGIFPQFAATAATFSRASTLITRVGTDAALYDDPQDVNIAALLDSKYDAEKAQGMKRLIALMSQGIDVAHHFPQVVKNIVSTSLEVKKLVYIYLVHFAEKRPDEALLSINGFQKDLSDVNPLVRAWALRAMSGIRVRVVLPIVVMAVNKAARDPSPYVRRCAAHAVPKVFSLDHEQHAVVLQQLICLLLNDSSPGVVGAAAAAYTAVCPEKLHIIGPVFRKLCEMLPDVDEWGQVAVLDILMHFAMARHGAPRNSVGLSSFRGGPGCDDGVKESTSWFKQKPSNPSGIDECEAPLCDLPGLYTQDEDDQPHLELRLLLQCTSPLLWSQNSAVVMAAAVSHWLFAPKVSLTKIAKPLLFLLRSSFDTQYVVLSNIATFVRAIPSLFEQSYEDFFVRPNDNLAIRAMKLDILTQVATESSINAILEEFQAYVRDPDRQFAADTVSAIGRCAARVPAVGLACLDGLFKIIESSIDVSCWEDKDLNAESDRLSKAQTQRRYALGYSPADTRESESMVITQAVLSIRLILQELTSERKAVFSRLVRFLDRLKVPSARAIIVWMVGEYSSTGSVEPSILPIVMSYVGGTFSKEANETKLQILNCAVKVVVRKKSDPDFLSKGTRLVLQYILELGCLDLNCDIRDRARMLQKLLVSELEPVKPGAELSDSGVPTENVVSDPSDKVPVQMKDSADGVLKSGKEKNFDESVNILRSLADMLFLFPRSAPALPSLSPERTSFLPGSMSHIVQHRAPGYRPLPEPCSWTEAQDLVEGQSAEDSKEDSIGCAGDGDLEEEVGDPTESENDITEEEDSESEERGTTDSHSAGSSGYGNLIDI